MAILNGMSPCVKGCKFDVTAPEVSIGRTTANMIVIEEPSVSSKHALIKRDGNKFVVFDLESTNGTRINGTPVQEGQLFPKDIVQFGNIELMFDGDDIEVEPASGEASSTSAPRVEVLNEPIGIPASFNTNSPYGTRRENRRFWWILIGSFCFLAIVALVYFLIKLFG